ncbi:hypothetical protein [Pontiella sulfatireligans]|uniref:Uncharacterized protein n=1 Tax=Pontiella sulfatireligans TaxID=2750658 RepID=A0A6C2UTL4_9BACT|nr:hypothetical protein [Pontiella sulfatireligans]VGO22574.1 hypothetical protein SCARR_04659 [Pontiella sulfatireligans]
MFDRGQEFILKVEGKKLFFSDCDFLPVEKVVLDHPDDRGMEIESFAFRRFPWIKLWVQRFSDGVLDCDVSDFKPAAGFGSQAVDLSTVRKMSVFVDKGQVLDFALAKPKPAIPKPAPPKPCPRPFVPPKPPPKPEPFDETVCFTVPLDRIRFEEGCATVGWGGRLSLSGRFVRFEASIENSFVSEKLNCIKPYLAKCLGSGEVEIRAAVRGRGDEVEAVEAESAAIASISPGMIGEVRFRYVKGELRKWRRGKRRVTTAARFFERIHEVGFGESDTDFLVDILRARDAKHSAHVEYLAGLHHSNLVRLRLVKDPFSFLCFLPGKSDCFFAWETFEGTDATYLWSFGKPPEYLVSHKQELKRWLGWVETQLDLIHAAGRDEYHQNASPSFRRVFHSYKEAGGFEKWKDEIQNVLEQ